MAVADRPDRIGDAVESNVIPLYEDRIKPGDRALSSKASRPFHYPRKERKHGRVYPLVVGGSPTESPISLGPWQAS